MGKGDFFFLMSAHLFSILNSKSNPCSFTKNFNSTEGSKITISPPCPVSIEEIFSKFFYLYNFIFFLLRWGPYNHFGTWFFHLIYRWWSLVYLVTFQRSTRGPIAWGLYVGPSAHSYTAVCAGGGMPIFLLSKLITWKFVRAGTCILSSFLSNNSLDSRHFWL